MIDIEFFYHLSSITRHQRYHVMKKDNATSYYDILNVHPRSSDDDIKRAYHAQAKRFHPDRNPQNRRMAELRLRLINEAYTTLKTRESRAYYNRRLRVQADAQNDNTNGGSFFTKVASIFRTPSTTNNEKRDTQ